MAGTAIYFKLKDKVIDGTPCNQETTDICVDGKCLVRVQFNLAPNVCLHSSVGRALHRYSRRSRIQIPLNP